MSSRTSAFALVIFSAGAFWAPESRAVPIPLGDASNYAVLFQGLGGKNLSVTNVTIDGNVGVGNTGKVQFSGPGTIDGRLDFSAGNTGQFSNTNAGNVGPGSVNYGQGNVTSDLSYLSLLSATLGGAAGTAVSLINGNQTINESSGQLFTSGGVTYRVFTVNSVHDQAGQTLKIVGDGSGAPIVFNFSANANLQGDVDLSGLVDDQVLWNFAGGSNGTGGPTASLNNNASSYPQLAWHGILLDPNGPMSLVNANLDGRVFGGDTHDMQIVSGTKIRAPAISAPEPGALPLLGAGLASLAFFRRRKVKPALN
jgi:hypothetical protein